MGRKKVSSISSRLNLWYTVLMGILSVALIFCVVTVARTSENSEAQQNLIRSVERNIDEIEVENGLLDIESDFAYRNGDIYAIVYSADGEILGGEYPDGVRTDIQLESERFDKFDGFYVYDTKVEFVKYDYKINGKTGEKISSEVEGADFYTPFEESLDFLGEDCEISCRDAFEIAVEKSELDASQISIINVKSYKYNDEPIYEVEFHSNQKAYEDIWVRGVVKANAGNGIWGVLARVAAILLPLFIFVCSLAGKKISKRALEPVELLSKAVEETHSGKDLTKRVSVPDADPMISGLADKFNDMFSRLQLSFENERQFSSDVSHELRTPTAVILAECEYQLSRAELDEESREGIEGIEKQAQSMKKLIASLLEITKMEQQSTRHVFETEDLSLLVGSVADSAKSLDKKNITLVKDIEKGIMMNMEVLMMTRLVTNLLSNAFNYGKQDGCVTISLKKEASLIRLSVSDDGIGIPEEHLEKIWNRFYRVDKARCREEGCSGLGLPMVKQIALLHRGSISVKSTVGEGTTFTVEFPDILNL